MLYKPSMLKLITFIYIMIHQDTSRYIKIHQDTSLWLSWKCISPWGIYDTFMIHLGYIQDKCTRILNFRYMTRGWHAQDTCTHSPYMLKALDRIGGAIFGCGLPVLFLVVVPVHVTRTGKSQPRTGHTRALSTGKKIHDHWFLLQVGRRFLLLRYSFGRTKQYRTIFGSDDTGTVQYSSLRYRYSSLLHVPGTEQKYTG